ncbi:MAG: hypothetical protein ACRECU_02520 [Methylocella sp.]
MPKHRVPLLERRTLHVCKYLNLTHKLGRLVWLVIAACDAVREGAFHAG